jgi:hypothetical protein
LRLVWQGKIASTQHVPTIENGTVVMPRGGAMPDGSRRGGRRKGAKNKRSLALIAAVQQTVEGAKPDELPAEFLRRVAQNEALDLSVRIAAAQAAAPFFSPKLSNVDLNAKTQNAHFFIADHRLTPAEWEAKWCKAENPPAFPNDEIGYIAGQGDVPPSQTADAVNRLQVELRDRKIEILEETVAKLQEELKLERDRAAKAREIPLLS